MTKRLSARWNDGDIKQLLLIMGFANLARPSPDSLNELLQDCQQSKNVRKQQDDISDTRTGPPPAADSPQFVSAPSTGFRQPGLFSGIPTAIQLLIVTVVILVIAFSVYRMSVSHMENSMLEDVSSYVESGHDISLLRADGNPPLHMAARKGYMKVADYLLQHGADINAKDPVGWTALHHAVYANDVDMVRLLMDNGAERHHQAGMGSVTPGWIASQEGYDDIVLELNRARW